MKTITYILIFNVIVVTGLWGQRAALTSQFAYDKLSLTPAFAGVQPYGSVTAIYRNQWLGFEGAPETQTASVNVPFQAQNMGLGLNLNRYVIGVTEQVSADLMYAYHAALTREWRMSIGIQGSYWTSNADFNDPRLIASGGVANDPSIPGVSTNTNFFNLGTGIYLHSEDLYFGVSMPRMMRNMVGDSENPFDLDRIWYAMAGGKWRLNDNLEVSPQVLLRYPQITPWNLESNITLTYQEKFSAGINATWSNDLLGVLESIDFLFAVHINDMFSLGGAYDFSMSDINQVSNGTVEIMAQYRFNGILGNGDENNIKETVNPRFF